MSKPIQIKVYRKWPGIRWQVRIFFEGHGTRVFYVDGSLAEVHDKARRMLTR